MIRRAFLAVVAAAFGLVASSATADTIASWTFETSVPATAGPFAPEVGSGSAIGSHLNASAVYSNPAGNGSAESFSSNFWSVGDYYEFTVSTTGFQNIQISWDQTGSNTGPRDFDLQYSVGGGAFSSVTSYALANDAWSAAVHNPASTRQFDFSSFVALNNASSVSFRLLNTSTVAISSANPVATAGTGRVDNFTVSGVAAIPEPGTLAVSALIGLGLLAGARRRK